MRQWDNGARHLPPTLTAKYIQLAEIRQADLVQIAGHGSGEGRTGSYVLT